VCQTKSFFLYSRVEKLSTELEKIVANNTPEKQLISKVFKELLQLKSKPYFKKWTKNLNRCFFKYTPGQQIHKRCSTALIIRERQIKTTMRHHLTSVKTLVIPIPKK
jgi:hypothetical protein